MAADERRSTPIRFCFSCVYRHLSAGIILQSFSRAVVGLFCGRLVNAGLGSEEKVEMNLDSAG
jgi:hypothetical protein